MTKKEFSPHALSEGRIARGYNKAQLANAIGVTRQAMSLIERGDSEPRPETLSKIASELRLPLTYFYRDPPEDFKKEGPTFFRKLLRSTDLAHQAAIIKAKWHYAGYLELTKYLKKIEVNLPRFGFDQTFDVASLTDDLIEDCAGRVRAYWGLGLGPIFGITPLLEKNGALVFQMNLDSDISGFSFYAKGNVPIVVCAANVSGARNRFNLAHELAHLLLHATLDQAELDESHKTIEDQAHRFAGALLFPKERFLEEFFSTDLHYLGELKRRWGMSMTAMVERGYNLGILSEEEHANFYRRNPRIRKQEAGDDEVQVERPTFPQNGLKAILEANLITVDDLKSDLPFGNEDLAEIFYRESSFFDSGSTAATKTSNIIEFKIGDTQSR